jgi:predicted Zn-dependent protease with MMP-like domain
MAPRDRGDRLHTDLERGFTALDAGDVEAAAAIVERCRRIDRKHPDVIELGALVAEAQGEVDAALAGYRALVELRPDHPPPRIGIARIELHDLDDPDAALDTIEAAFDFIDEEDDLVEAIIVKVEALLARGEPAAARDALAELATSAISEPALALELGELALAAEDPAAAGRWAEIARTSEDFAADALHLLGRIHEATNDRAAMIHSWLEVRRLDLAADLAGPPELTISDDELEQIALAALAELPERIRGHLERVPILIDDVPSEPLVAEGFDPRALGLFEGTPMPEEGSAIPQVTHILLFKRNLEHAARDREHLAEEIRITVLHETAHFFGLDEDDLEALGLD